jgi:subtilisin family serine protease
MLSSLVLALFLVPSPNYYHSTTGEVGLVPAPDVVVLHSETGLPGELVLRELDEVDAKKIYRHTYLIDRTQVADNARLANLVALKQWIELPAYRRRGANDIYVSDGRINAGFHPERSLAWVENAVLSAGATSVKQAHAKLGWYEITVRDSTMVFDVANRLVESGDARFAHPDFIYKKTRMFSPNDELKQYQWHLDQVSASSAWNTEQGHSGIRIAIIDSGVEWNHPDLDGKLVDPYDALDEDYN